MTVGPPAGQAAVALLPAVPGVYRFRDARQRALYIGRTVSLRARVSSYWGDLGDRQHLTAMVPRIAAIEAVVCDSEHEAAWLERNLLERHLPPWNRSAGGQESVVYIRLDGSPRSPGLAVTHIPRPGRAVRHFGPYLGGARVRLAVSALHRVLPLGYAGNAPAGALRELGRQRGVGPADRTALADAVTAVLEREPAAVAELAARLTERRDAAARGESYELAGRLQAELAAVSWVVSPQRAARPALGDGSGDGTGGGGNGADADVAGWAGGVLVHFEVRDGSLRGWRQSGRTLAQARPWLARTPPQWREFAQRNADLAARLAGPATP